MRVIFTFCLHFNSSGTVVEFVCMKVEKNYLSNEYFDFDLVPSMVILIIRPYLFLDIWQNGSSRDLLHCSSIQNHLCHILLMFQIPSSFCANLTIPTYVVVDMI